MAQQPSTTPGQKAAPAVRTAKPLNTAAPKGAAVQAGSQQAAQAQRVANQAAKAQPAEEHPEEEYHPTSPLMQQLPSWLASLVLHVVALVIMGLIVTEEAKKEEIGQEVVAAIDAVEKPLEELKPVNDTPVEIQETTPDTAVDVPDAELSDTTEVSEFKESPAPEMRVEVDPLGVGKAISNDLAKQVGRASGTGLDGRGARRKKALGNGSGASGKSEEAVERALKWIADHQNYDGSWNWDHRKSPAPGPHKNAGSINETLGATGMALLPFMAAGHTTKEGKYSKNVKAGLYYIANKMNKQSGSCHEPRGTMYAHGLCAIALCEGYAMSKDPNLRGPAQGALNFIASAQDPVGGGWRYEPKMAGDTSVVGWQLMALKSGHMAYLNVDPKTIKGAINFLNSVQEDSGSRYGYTSPGPGPATTAIGLLCRMYLGWKQDNGALVRGADFLSKQGFSKSNCYYNYYATQVMMHMYFDKPEWKTWNDKMHEVLIPTQEKQGSEMGSWYMAGDHGSETGGRLYCTCMSVLCLEVYYRLQPIYSTGASEADFAD